MDDKEKIIQEAEEQAKLIKEGLDKKPENGPKLGKTLVILLFVLMFVVGFVVGHFLLESNKNDKSNNKENIEEKKEEDKPTEELKDTPVEEPVEQTDETPVEEPKEITYADAIDKLETFTKAALYSDDSSGTLSYDFVKGYSTLTVEDKLKITYDSLVHINRENTKVEEVPEKYNDELSYWTGATITVLSIERFNDEYKYLFNEEISVNPTSDSRLGCPFLYKYDEELGNIYFSNQCGGTGSPYLRYKTYKITEDDNYYYVYQYVGTESSMLPKEFKKIKSDEVVDVDSFDGNEEMFETIIWKFDKNLIFVSTENIG